MPQKVPTNLGGRLFGYLGIVLRDVTYNTIPNTLPFIQSTHPGPCIPLGARLTQVEIIQEKARHEEVLRLFDEFNHVESILRTQLIEAVPVIYLEPLRDETSNMISNSILDIIDYLQNNYRKLTVEEVNDREYALKNTVFNP